MLRLEEVKEIEEPSSMTAGNMLGHEISSLMIRTNNEDKKNLIILHIHERENYKYQ